MSNYIVIGQLNETEIYEKLITKVNSSGKKTRRKKAPKGFKYVNGRLTKISSMEKIARKKGAKIAARKRRGHKAEINRKTKRAKGYRKSYGL